MSLFEKFFPMARGSEFHLQPYFWKVTQHFLLCLPTCDCISLATVADQSIFHLFSILVITYRNRIKTNKQTNKISYLRSNIIYRDLFWRDMTQIWSMLAERISWNKIFNGQTLHEHSKKTFNIPRLSSVKQPSEISKFCVIRKWKSSSCSQKSSHDRKFDQFSCLHRRHDCLKFLIFKE